jgi:hypothetical protein
MRVTLQLDLDAYPDDVWAMLRDPISRRGDVRILEDTGGPVSGALGVITGWRHRMAVSPLPGGRTFYRDRLDISAGVLTPLVWFVTWLLWQYRAVGIRRVVAARARRA